MKSGKPNHSIARSQLGKRDRAILDDVLRFRVLTNELVHLRHFSHATPNATSKVTQRLANSGWLTRHDYIHGRWYFVVGNQLCRRYGLPVSRTQPLGTQSLTSAMAASYFCLRSAPALYLLQPSDFQAHWPWIPNKLRVLPHAVDSGCEHAPAAAPALRLIRVDLGGTPKHVAQKCQQDFKVRASLGGFVQLLSDRRLLYVVLTTTEIKKQLIMRELKKRNWPTNARFEIIVVDELCFLLTHLEK